MQLGSEIHARESSVAIKPDDGLIVWDEKAICFELIEEETHSLWRRRGEVETGRTVIDSPTRRSAALSTGSPATSSPPCLYQPNRALVIPFPEVGNEAASRKSPADHGEINVGHGDGCQ